MGQEILYEDVMAMMQYLVDSGLTGLQIEKTIHLLNYDINVNDLWKMLDERNEINE